jgi:hypothetical protein
MLTTELCSTQPTLRIRRHDLRHLRTTATTETVNCRDGIFTHAFSESSSKAYGKNGLGRRDTVELAGGRRIAVSSGFDAATLTRLIAVLEQA